MRRAIFSEKVFVAKAAGAVATATVASTPITNLFIEPKDLKISGTIPRRFTEKRPVRPEKNMPPLFALKQRQNGPIVRSGNVMLTDQLTCFGVLD